MRAAQVAGAALVFAAAMQCQQKSGGPQSLSLQEAQARAAAASKMSELANLGVDAARYHRLGVQADYFPKISSFFSNLHFNKFLGAQFVLRNRTIGLPLVNKDQSVFAVTAVQPVTPILQIRQAVRIARADERIAQAKADAAAAALKSNVQSAYFALLVAQRQQVAAEAEVRRAERQLQFISTRDAPRTTNLAAEKALLTANSRVNELSEALSVLIGAPAGASYELSPPPAIDDGDNGPAPALAVEKNPEVVEARETVEKARAAVRLAKLNYVPEVAGFWNYTNQNAIPALPQDFSIVGFTATWTVFDFGKRERLVQERSTQLRMAEANLQLVRAKVSSGTAKATSDFQRTRRILELTRRVVSMMQPGTDVEARGARAQAEAEMFQADLDFRVAYTELRRTAGTP